MIVRPLLLLLFLTEIGALRPLQSFAMSNDNKSDEPKQECSSTLGTAEFEQVVEGLVTDADFYGAVIELSDGRKGFIHITELSWTEEFNDARKVLKKGIRVRAKIISGVSNNSSLLSLSIKQLRPNPWSQALERLPKGSELRCSILSIYSYGIVCDVGEGLTGFIHCSSIPSFSRKRFTRGQLIQARIENVDIRNHRISLGYSVE